MNDPEPLFTLYGVTDGTIIQPRWHDERNRALRWIGWVLPRGVADPGTVGLDRITALVNTHGGLLLQVSQEMPDGTRSFAVTFGSGNGYSRPGSFYQMMRGDARLSQEPLTTGEIRIASDVRVFVPVSADSDRLLEGSQGFLEGLTAPQAEAVIEVLRDPEEFARLIALGRAAKNGSTQGTAKPASAPLPKVATPKPQQVATKPPPRWPVEDEPPPRRKPPSGRGRFPLWAKLGIASVVITVGVVGGFLLHRELRGTAGTELSIAWAKFEQTVTEHADAGETKWKFCPRERAVSAQWVLSCEPNYGTLADVSTYLLSAALDDDPYLADRWDPPPRREVPQRHDPSSAVAMAKKHIGAAKGCLQNQQVVDGSPCVSMLSEESLATSLGVLTEALKGGSVNGECKP